MVGAAAAVVDYPATVSLPHQDTVRGQKGKFTWAVPPKPILEEMLSRFSYASWGQTQKALGSILSPISPDPHCGKASSLQ